MSAKDSVTQREKREIDRRLDEELEGTFPASDPPKITRSSAKSPGVVVRTRGTTSVPKVQRRHLSVS
jgi:hypothetical protein